MDTPGLRTFLRQQYGARAKLYDTQKQYRTDMPAKWNVHSEQVSRMLKKAVSFRPIVDIQKFITENICDIPDKPDIEAMRQNIRDYKRHEQLARRQEELTAACAQSDVLHEENRLNAEKSALLKEQKGLFTQVRGTALEIKREASLLCGLCRKVSQWRDAPLV